MKRPYEKNDSVPCGRVQGEAKQGAFPKIGHHLVLGHRHVDTTTVDQNFRSVSAGDEPSLQVAFQVLSSIQREHVAARIAA